MSRMISDTMTAVTVILLITFLSHHARAETGTWRMSTGEVVSVTCPSQELQDDETMTLRLPGGCRVLHPRVGYTLTQDLNLRSELTTLRSKVDLLTKEVANSRSQADVEAMTASTVLTDTRGRLDTCNGTRHDLEVKLVVANARSASLEQAMVERVALGVALGVIGGAGGLALILALMN